MMLTGCGRETMTSESRLAMGTIVTVKIPHAAKEDVRSAIKESFRKVDEVERLINKYDQNSECAAINRLAPGSTIRISRQMSFVLRKALELHNVTGGAFDVTVSPLIDLWDLYKEKNALPPTGEIKEALLKVGSRNIALDEEDLLSFVQDGAEINLSGIAKGYAVDQVVSILRKKGIKNGLVDAGGDIYCLGPGLDNRGWRIGIKHPRKDSRFIGQLTLFDKAVATSGDYQDFFVVNKRRYSHILDPRNGYPVSDTPMSVTVVAPGCLTADGLATAITVMGAVEGFRLAEELEEIDAVIVSDTSGGLKIDITSGLKDSYEDL